MTTRLTTDIAGYLACPRRGDISVDWCSGCPVRVDITDTPDGVVIVLCDSEPSRGPGHSGSASPLRDLPALWA